MACQYKVLPPVFHLEPILPTIDKRSYHSALGNIFLTDLRPANIQVLYDEKLKAGLSPRTVQLIHVVIHRSLSQAVKLGLLEKNPDDVTVPPRVVHPEMWFFDESQVAQLLVAAQGDQNEVLNYIALYTGMRQAELLALRWSDMDWQKKTIQVQRQLRRDFREMDELITPIPIELHTTAHESPVTPT